MEKTFEHSSLEQDIQRLSAEIKSRGLAEHGKEAVRTVVKEQLPTGVPSAAPSAAPQPVQPIAKPSGPIPNYLQQESAEVKLKVEKLLDLAVHKGIKRAASEAKSSDAVIVDAFHDALVDKLYGELKARGMLK